MIICAVKGPLNITAHLESTREESSWYCTYLDIFWHRDIDDIARQVMVLPAVIRTILPLTNCLVVIPAPAAGFYDFIRTRLKRCNNNIIIINRFV